MSRKQFIILGAILMLGLSGCRKKNDSPINEGLYFIRCATFDDIGGQIVVIDSNAPRAITMDPWPQLVFLAADGQYRISDFIKHLGTKYEGDPPEGLDKQIHETVQTLKEEGIIRLMEEPEELPYYLSMPMSQLDMDKAKELMEKDGFIKSK